MTNDDKVTIVASPCVRNCCLDEQDICVGCFRHIEEIVGWQRRTEQQQREILKKCQSRRERNSR